MADTAASIADFQSLLRKARHGIRAIVVLANAALIARGLATGDLPSYGVKAALTLNLILFGLYHVLDSYGRTLDRIERCDAIGPDRPSLFLGFGFLTAAILFTVLTAS
jgi:hypothetical protein